MKVVAFGLLAPAACGGNGPSADEERVCDSIQKVVDDLAAGRSQDAIDTLVEFHDAVTATSNGTMSTAGDEFFEVFDTRANRFEMTVPEVDALGNQFLADFTRALDAVVAECREVGASIERLPQS